MRDEFAGNLDGSFGLPAAALWIGTTPSRKQVARGSAGTAASLFSWRVFSIRIEEHLTMQVREMISCRRCEESCNEAMAQVH